MAAIHLLPLFLSIVLECSYGSAVEPCGFQSCNPVKEGMLNVHLVPHTHDDVGWLKTVDQYYYGARQDIQRAGVCYILDSVIPELLENPDRRFIYVEIAFFWRWWQEQREDMKQDVIQLVNQGRLEFTLGGWCMNDEGATHYNAIIDQHTLGLRFLNETFGQCAHPKVAWQIDPFGHSRQQASLFAQMGFDALYFGRIDYQDKATRLKDKTMEVIWRGSPDNLGSASDLFSGTLFNGYGPPAGFCYDLTCTDPPIMDDPRLHDHYVKYQVKSFISAATDQSHHYTTQHIMMTMGSDFQYSNAHTWYKNLDKLIKYVNAEQEASNSTVNVLYSTPSCYTYHVNKANQSYTTKTDDFFPYAIKPHGFLTGFFTSRPQLKGLIRDVNNGLQVARQIHALAVLQDSDESFNKLFQLEEAMGVAQHHDAISGTEKQAVANDYSDRLGRAYINVGDIIQDGLNRLIGKSYTKNDRSVHCISTTRRPCAVKSVGQKLQIVAWNPLTRPVKTYITIVVFSRGVLYDAQGHVVQIETFAARDGEGQIVYIPAHLPPLGLSVFYWSPQPGIPKPKEKYSSPPLHEDKVVGNKLVSLVFDGTTGRLKQMRNVEKGVSISLEQELQYYIAYPDDPHDQFNQASGAYIFRPNGSSTHTFPRNEFKTTFVEGKLVQEIQQVFSPWASQSIRIYEGRPDVEFEWRVGPIPFKDKQGKEVINLFKTNLNTKGIFYTDANGRDMIERRLNHRETWNFNNTEPIAGNYYPVNSRIYIKDEDQKAQLTVLTDRSQGGSSIHNGEIELMVHRRLLFDDHLGVGEALNETGPDGNGLVAAGSHYLLLDTIEASPAKHRLLAEELFMRPYVVATEAEGELDIWLQDTPANKSFIQDALPANVHLLTLQQLPGQRSNLSSYLLLRLEHQFEKADDPGHLSNSVSVNITSLFTPFEVVNLEELTLGGNMPLSFLHRLKWRSSPGDSSEDTDNNTKKTLQDPFVIHLNPMEIRTFKIQIFYKK